MTADGRVVCSKYTLLLDLDRVERLDSVVTWARRQLGRKVDRSEVLRVLIDRIAADDLLRDQILSALTDGVPS